MVKTGPDNHPGSDEEISQNPDITTKVFTKPIEQEYFRIFNDYRKDYIDAIVDENSDPLVEPAEKTITTLNAKLYKDLLKINKRNTKERLCAALTSSHLQLFLESEGQYDFAHDPLYNVFMNKSLQIIPCEKIKNLIDIKPFVDTLVSRKKFNNT